MNNGLKIRLDDANRFLEQANTEKLDLCWQLDRERKRSLEAAEREEVNSTTLKAARDYYRGQLDMKGLELKKMKNNLPPSPATNAAPSTVTPPTTTPLQDWTNANINAGADANVSTGKASESNKRPRGLRDGEISLKPHATAQS